MASALVMSPSACIQDCIRTPSSRQTQKSYELFSTKPSNQARCRAAILPTYGAPGPYGAGPRAHRGGQGPARTPVRLADPAPPSRRRTPAKNRRPLLEPALNTALNRRPASSLPPGMTCLKKIMNKI